MINPDASFRSSTGLTGNAGDRTCERKRTASVQASARLIARPATSLNPRLPNRM
jgi:hypothetical protein